MCISPAQACTKCTALFSLLQRFLLPAHRLVFELRAFFVAGMRFPVEVWNVALRDRRQAPDAFTIRVAGVILFAHCGEQFHDSRS